MSRFKIILWGIYFESFSFLLYPYVCDGENFLLTESSNRPSNNNGRRTSSSSITSESIKKAQQVYCAKQPKPRYYSAGVGTGVRNQPKSNQSSSNSSSIASIRTITNENQEVEVESNTNQIIETNTQQNNINNNHSRTTSLSPMKRTNTKTCKSPTAAVNKGHQSLRNGGPKIAKPVIKPQMKPSVPTSNKNSTVPSQKRQEQSKHKDISYNKNSRLPIPPSSSSISSNAPSPSITPVGANKNKSSSALVSRIPTPGNSQSPMKKSRIPSASKYNPPQRKVLDDVSRGASATPSPPPPPPPSEMMQQEECKLKNIAVGRCSPSSTPTPTPPESPLIIRSARGITCIDDGEEEDDVLCVHPDGQVEIRPSSSSRASTSTPSTVTQYMNRNNANKDSEETVSQTNVSPWKPVPEPSNYQPPIYATSRKITPSTEHKSNNLKEQDSNIHEDSSGYSGGENASSADDEGSRDGEEDEEDGRRRSIGERRYSSTSSSSKDRRDSVERINQDDLSSPGTSVTKNSRKAESAKQGLAARRIQRTWKHFYQEVSQFSLIQSII